MSLTLSPSVDTAENVSKKRSPDTRKNSMHSVFSGFIVSRLQQQEYPFSIKFQKFESDYVSRFEITTVHS